MAQPRVYIGVGLTLDKARFWVLAILSGLLMALSSAPYDQWYLAYIAFVPVFLASYDAPPLRQGLAFALCGTVTVVNWWHSAIIYSFPLFLLILLILAFAFLIWAMLCAPFRSAKANPLLSLFMPAVLWTGIERILCSEWVGVPCNLGITQSSQPLLIQSAALFGIYTTSFVIILTNTALAMLLHQFIAKQRRGPQYTTAVGLGLMIFAADLVYGYSQLSNREAALAPIKVAIIQPVISSNLYANGWRDPEAREFVRTTLDELMQTALAADPDLLVWPEGGNGYLNMRIGKLRDKLYKTALDHNLALLISSNDLDEAGRKFNTVFSISDKGTLLGRYDKVMLIPGAEDRYTPGDGFRPLDSSYGKIGAVICYESNFPSTLRQMTDAGAGLLFVSTSDAPFKKTSLAISHTRMSVFRAVENRRWVIHASNTGPSVIVSPQGFIKAAGGFYQRGFVAGHVGYRNDKSPFVRFGYVVPIIFSAGVLILLMLRGYLFYKSRRVQQGGIRDNSGPPVKAGVSRAISRGALIPLVRQYLPASLLLGLLLCLLITSSIVIAYRMAPGPGSAFDAMQEFFTPLDAPATDKTGDRFLQASSNTCGPAVLAYLFSYHGQEVLESELIPRIKIGTKGTSMLELKNTALKYGFQAQGVKENYVALMKEPLPVIAYLNESHYVVVNKITSRSVYLFDPLLGHIEINRNYFERAWNGYLLLIRMQAIKTSLAY